MIITNGVELEMQYQMEYGKVMTAFKTTEWNLSSEENTYINKIKNSIPNLVVV